MDAAAIIYILVFLAVLVAVVVTVVLFARARRVRKEQSLVGFTAISKDEKYAGYSLLTIGIIIIFFSIYEMLTLLTGGVSSTAPFGLSDISITTGGQATVVASGQILGIIASIFFWLLILTYGGRKIATLGLDMLKGRKIKLRRTLRKTAIEQ